VPSGTNGRGLREVGAARGLAPGLADADAGDPDDGGRAALLLFETARPEPELARATSVIAFAQFRDETLDEHADVVFPASVYAEKEGTVTHPDGRIQRVRQALGHPDEARASWWVLAELCERVGAGTGALSSAEVTVTLAEAVPFYAGLTLDEIGGRGVRWQEREGASNLPHAEPSAAPLAAPEAPAAGLLASGVPTLWAGPEIEHSERLRFLATGPQAELSPQDAAREGIATGEEVRLSANGQSIVATARVRTGVPEGSVFVTDAPLAPGPAEVAKAERVLA
jgi:NADH-quinone oxidoreductase subunit G